ncbi:hypothetical protein [uncultured Roseovarius sp.]|uniref:hypothetical protein n=1 Tax=uncultured Roseovarius sp. TaxID=293344 RepID=UPI002633B43E|nr:hypothetical protein [uncultured Roseovarius sp.]
MRVRFTEMFRRGLALTGLFIGLGLGAAQAGSHEKITDFDVAEDHTRFVFDEAPVHDEIIQQTFLGFGEHGGVKVRFAIPEM